jgi:3-methyladenine DNA glycosylase AlkD
MEASRRTTLLETVGEIEARLQVYSDAERAAGAKRYLKSDLDFLGVAVPDLRREVRTWAKAHPDLDRNGLSRLCRALWQRDIHELRIFAIELLRARKDCLECSDIALLEWMLRRSNTWAYVDAIAVHLVGPMVERCPQISKQLDRWARDDSFWLRRSAMLALLLPLRRGSGDWKRFERYADAMLEEREFFIRKAIGWVLREVSKRDPQRVSRFVTPRVDRVSGVTIREAVKYLTEEDRKRLLSAYRSR